MLTGSFRVCQPLFLLEEREGGTAVGLRDKEGAGSTETTGLEKPEAGPAARKHHVTGDRDSRGGGRACLRGAVPPLCGGPWARCVCPPFLNFVCSYLSGSCLVPRERGLWHGREWGVMGCPPSQGRKPPQPWPWRVGAAST